MSPYYSSPAENYFVSARGRVLLRGERKSGAGTFFDEAGSIASPVNQACRASGMREDWRAQLRNIKLSTTESLILAQDERWRRA